MPDIKMPDGVVVRFPDSMPEAQIKSLILSKFPDLGKPKGVLGYAEDVVRSLAEGATFGYAGEAAAKADELLGSGTYEENLKAQNARDAEISPYIAIPGQIGGAIGSTIAAAPVLGPLAARAGLAQLPRALRYMGIGAGEGAVMGSGQAEPGKRLEGAKTGGAVGAAVGLAAPYVAGGVGRVARELRGALQPSANVSADIGRALARDSDTAASIQSRLTAAQADRPGATIGDVGGENVRGLVERVAQTPGAGRTIVVPNLTAKQQGQMGRLTNDLRSLTGTQRTAREAVEQTMAQRQADAQPLYQKAFQFPAESNAAAVMAFERETAQGWGASALRSPEMVKTLQSDYGIENVNDAPLMVLIDAWKKTMDDLAGSALRGGSNNVARSVSQSRDRVLAAIDKANPDYATARAAWSGPSRYLDAVESGGSIFKTPSDEFIADFASRTPAEQEAIRTGAISQIVARMGSDPAKLADMTKYLRSPEMRAKIAALMPNNKLAQTWLRRLEYEVKSSELTGRALGNSATARRLAEQDQANGIVGDLILDMVTGASPAGLLSRIVRGGAGRIRDTLRSRSDALLAPVLTDPAQAQQLQQILRGIGNAGRPMTDLGAANTIAGSLQLFGR